MRAFFLMPFLTKKSQQTRAVETFKIWPKFESFHSLCPMRFFVENWLTKTQGHKKNFPHFLRRRVRPFPLPHSWQLGQFYSIKEAIGKDTCPDSVGSFVRYFHNIKMAKLDICNKLSFLGFIFHVFVFSIIADSYSYNMSKLIR